MLLKDCNVNFLGLRSYCMIKYLLDHSLTQLCAMGENFQSSNFNAFECWQSRLNVFNYVFFNF
ncbi:hypothetical protein ASG51_00630 [Methylobacterium sp. Leaf465]|nr:hypothetical protein ASG51_00630 [Methylobacterium sp. Leaf465]